MSDDDVSMFSSEGEDSAFSPEPAKKPAKKAAAPKKDAAPKKTAAPRKAPAKKAATKKRAASDRADESDSGKLTSSPPSAKKQKKAPAKKAKATAGPLKSKENDMDLDNDDNDLNIEERAERELANVAAVAAKKNSSETYQKLTQLEHILKRPDTYIGSVEPTERTMWVFDSNTNMMAWKTVTIVPGLYKIFDEILVNAADNKIRDPKMDTLKVTIDRENNEVSVYNNGRGIPIELHQKEKIYIPELIFGHLLTSSNYDDDEKKVTGGRNGYGAKLCNIFSTEFTVETADKDAKQKYKQTWTANMSKMGKAKITSNAKGEEYTRITFKPDLSKFQMTEMDADLESVLKRRVYDLAGTVKNVKVFLNGQRITKNFKSYCEMYVKALREENESDEKMEIIHATVGDRWEIAFATSGGNFQQVSFVNSIATTSGGTHVNVVADQLCTKLADHVKKKNKSGAAVKNAQMRNHFFLFVNCLIENPAFTSQTKEQLTTKQSGFGSKFVLPDDFVKKVQKTDVIQQILDYANLKADKAMQKSDGSRRRRINNPNLVDANRAGTKDSQECVLILTEGLSASSLARAGISSIGGQDMFGIFPLRGKVLNVRDASHDQIMKNVEIQNLKQVLGLQHKKVYESAKELRYGHIMIMTDQDYDGSHIKGLLINFLEAQYPSLLRLPNFLIEFITPIVKVYKGNPKKPTKQISFFTMPEYEYWKENNTEKGWEHKYYKGLGTSDEEDAKVYFADLQKHMKYFHKMEQEGSKRIELAFAKSKTDERKEWLRLYQPGTFLDHSVERISYPDFVDKELILFSIADCARSIPSVVDGLKPGQRKILFAAFKRKLTKELKVASLAGYVSDVTAYQHGEASLQSTITNMAQTFVGSNNVNLLEPNGNFGSRLQGGKDAASARYIYTQLSPFARKIFPQTDDPLLTYNRDDNKKIEPNWYIPVVPLVLINGADGIGTGWSSNIPNYNPEQVVDNIRRLMRNEEMVPMEPWYRDWEGTVEKLGDSKFKFTGKVRQIDDVRVEVTELPVKVWTQDFKEKLEEIIKGEKTPSFVKDYVDYNSPRRVHFIITFESEKHLKDALAEGLENRFKLTKTMTTTNLVAFDPEGRITRYNSIEDIMKEFYYIRLKFYQERKEHMLHELNRELLKLSNQARFVQLIIKKELVVNGKKRKDLIVELKQKGFDTFSKKEDASEAGETEEAIEDESVGDGYNYLLGMAIWSLTKEKVDALLKVVADKEEEVDVLIKKSPKDLWNADLDAFIEEWHLQLEEDKKRQNTVVKGKRGKGKIGAKAGAKGRKKKDDSDSDGEGWTPTKNKKAPAKKQTMLPFKAEPMPTEAKPEKKLAARAATKKAPIIDDDNLSDSDLEIVQKGKKPESQHVETKPDAGGASKKAPIAVDDDELSDSELEMVQQSKKAEPKAKPTTSGTAKENNDKDDDFDILTDAKPSDISTSSGVVVVEDDKPGENDSFVTADDEPTPEKPSKKAVAPTKPPAKAPTKKPAPAKKAAPKPKPAADEDSIFDFDDAEPPKATNAKPKRAAAKKPAIVDDDSEDSEAEVDDGLGDVSKLVKGMGDESAVSTRPLFAASTKPGSAAITAAASKAAANRKSTGKAFDMGDSDDDVVMAPPRKPAVTKRAPAPKQAVDLSDLENSDDEPVRPAPKKKAPAPKKAAPAKKAGAKPPVKGKGKKAADGDDEDVDQMANALLDSDDDLEMLDAPPKPAPAKPAAKPPAKPAASKPKQVESDDELDEEPVARARPTRAAGRTAAKPTYKFDSSDEEEEDEEEEEEEEDDYDENSE